MSGTLLGPDGLPMASSYAFENKKAAAPITGSAFGNWAGNDVTFATLPGGGVVQFDLSKLTVSDFRSMRDHYQINASLAILAFMQHQSTFHVECDDPKIADFCDEQLHNNWTMLNRAMSQANWAGYSPSVLDWENNVQDRSVELVKVKDMVPEMCSVNWKLEEGWAPPGHVKPKYKHYDGFKIFGQGWPTPVSNSFWYPLLMENGDYSGRKLLRPAFQSWFFSILLHLFANRYYERFGEPTPIGRAPFDQTEAPDGSSTTASGWMLNILQQLRNRSVVVLPNESIQNRDGRPQYEYDIEYLESQMRGADFERYMTRLDEEMSIGLFTPILLLRTADVGSYNLGVQHQQTYSLMIDALNDDRAYYLDRYILSPMTDYNFSPNAPRPKIKFQRMGNNNAQILRDIVVAMITNGTAKPDLDELGQALGMTLKQVRQTVAPPAADTPPADPAPSTDDSGGSSSGSGKSTGSSNRYMGLPRPMKSTTAVAAEICDRVRGQVTNAMQADRFNGKLRVNMGFRNRFARSLEADGVENAEVVASEAYAKLDAMLPQLLALGKDEFPTPESFMALFANLLLNEILRLS